jgi:hypothetical protein
MEGTEINLSRQVEGMDTRDPLEQPALSICPDALQTDQTVKSFSVEKDCKDRPVPSGTCEKFKMKYYSVDRGHEPFCMVGVGRLVSL